MSAGNLVPCTAARPQDTPPSPVDSYKDNYSIPFQDIQVNDFSRALPIFMPSL